LSETVPYHPYKLDVFIIGNMFKQEFCDVIISLSVTPRKAHNISDFLQHRIP
jgi:hypothetical protein